MELNFGCSCDVNGDPQFVIMVDNCSACETKLDTCPHYNLLVSPPSDEDVQLGKDIAVRRVALRNLKRTFDKLEAALPIISKPLYDSE